MTRNLRAKPNQNNLHKPKQAKHPTKKPQNPTTQHPKSPQSKGFVFSSAYTSNKYNANVNFSE